MAKKRKQGAPNRAKSLVAQPLFRCRREKPQKGKGSYRREASQNWEASSFQGPENSRSTAAALVLQSGERAA
ncbi:alternative ribosome rescue factor ArfA [Metapseudomonas furukawaii]|uniref:alternative ribosome rescue factor ArfA n=1 Tax=Metapseudomonas furukawaii TaxID=1149133 RepID=UPI0002AC45B8|nr:Hypothetical protein ppKF707_0332 [Pseudomonas furukawaii]